MRPERTDDLSTTQATYCVCIFPQPLSRKRSRDMRNNIIALLRCIPYQRLHENRYTCRDLQSSKICRNAN